MVSTPSNLRHANSGMEDYSKPNPPSAQLASRQAKRIDHSRLDFDIANIDERIGHQLDAILHHPDFQRLEAAWRGLKFLVDHTDFRKNVSIEVLDVDKDTLRQDFEDSPDIVQSGLFRHTYTEESRSIGLAQENLPASFVPLFRPPYGQRRADSGGFFASHGLYVALWNIDSQDWNEKVSADQVKQRVLTLMLLWRHGIILFHDIHPKAQVAVPWLHEQLRTSGIRWTDCKTLIATNTGEAP